MKEIGTADFIPVDISEHDVIEAMKLIKGYIDITPGDFKEVYQSAYALAIEGLLDSLTADKIMTKSVIFVDQEMPLVGAADLLAEKQISGCPVVDSEGKVVGVVSEKDFLKEMGFGTTPSFMQLATNNCRFRDEHRRHLYSFCGTPNQPVADCRQYWTANRYGHPY